MSHCVVQNGSECGSSEDQRCVKGVSSYYTAALLVSQSCTIAFISLPSAITHIGGWARALIFILICLAMNCHISVLIGRICKCCPGHVHYGDMVYAAFAKAPGWQRKAAKLLTDVSCWTYIFVSTSYNSLAMGKALGWSLDSVHLCLPIFMLFGMLLNIILQIPMRSFSALPWIPLVDVIAVLVFTLFPMVYFYGAARVSHAPVDVVAMGYAPLSAQLRGLSTIVFCFATQYVNVELISEMRNPADWARVVCIQAAPFQFFLIMLGGIGMYAILGNSSDVSTTELLPFGSELQTTSLGIIIDALITNLLQSIFLCHKLHEALDSAASRDGSVRNWFTWASTVGAMLSCSWFAANLIPRIEDFANLFGASVGPLTCYIIPIVTYIRIYADSKQDTVSRISIVEWILIACWFALSVLLMTYGTYSALTLIIQHFHNEGRPFSCNCSSMWNTCGCSANRPGMLCRP